jgi:hypothetical protein
VPVCEWRYYANKIASNNGRGRNGKYQNGNKRLGRIERNKNRTNKSARFCCSIHLGGASSNPSPYCADCIVSMFVLLENDTHCTLCARDYMYCICSREGYRTLWEVSRPSLPSLQTVVSGFYPLFIFSNPLNKVYCYDDLLIQL